MATSFFDYLYNADKPQESSSLAQEGSKTVEDEAIGSPWTHKFTVYCSNPAQNFLEELKAKDGVVAVYVKEKETSVPPTTQPPPNENK